VADPEAVVAPVRWGKPKAEEDPEKTREAVAGEVEVLCSSRSLLFDEPLGASWLASTRTSNDAAYAEVTASG
jgi:hypothetical protein